MVQYVQKNLQATTLQANETFKVKVEWSKLTYFIGRINELH